MSVSDQETASNRLDGESQIEYLINSLPEPEPEEEQVGSPPSSNFRLHSCTNQAVRFQQLEEEIMPVNEEYMWAVGRASLVLPCCLLQTSA